MKTETKKSLFQSTLGGSKEKQRQVHDCLHPSPAPVNSEKCLNSQPLLCPPPADLQVLHMLLGESVLIMLLVLHPSVGMF